VLKEINIVICYVGFIFKKIIANCKHVYSVGRFHQGFLYLQDFVKFENTSLNVPDVIYCHNKSTFFPAPIFMRLTNERQPCVQIAYIGICPNRIVNVKRMSKAFDICLTVHR